MINKEKVSVLVFSGAYLPGYKAGGPIRTIVNLFDKLCDEYDFFLVTADRDLGDDSKYPDITSNVWTKKTEVNIYYASPDVGWVLRVFWLLKSFSGKIIYFNSFFSFRHNIWPIICCKVLCKDVKIIVAPRGQFSSGAMDLKSLKKELVVSLSRTLNLYKNVTWQASSEFEAADIRRFFGSEALIRIATNISEPPRELVLKRRVEGDPLNLVFLSRISPKKNLIGALQILSTVSCPVFFDIYGPIEDVTYWDECCATMKSLPSHIVVSYRGALTPARVSEVLAQYDAFLLPTRGENFGHVVAEALGAGLPLVISDATPWRELRDKNLGWDIPLSNLPNFSSAIEYCFMMPVNDHAEWRYAIREWALKNIGDVESIEQSRRLFGTLVRAL